MEKQNPIAEMAKICRAWFNGKCYAKGEAQECDLVCTRGDLIKDLYNAGYRKIPEGTIILTKEEIAALNEYQKKHCTGGEPVEG